MTTLNEKIGARIRAGRESHGWSQDRLAQYAGLGAASVVSAYENGHRVPEGENLVGLCQALRCSADHLLGLDQDALAAHVRLRDAVSARLTLSAAERDDVVWEHRGGVTAVWYGGGHVTVLSWEGGCWRVFCDSQMLYEAGAIEHVAAGIEQRLIVIPPDVPRARRLLAEAHAALNPSSSAPVG